ncbi:potassium channel family protein [Tindallia californiensis]|uniref:Trk system potassium uptake protein TrkA n=1 Tax=Tindallia californiensis TaxID=159292 RepID=A0A1H3Q9U2_9FIRM|nr:TrkA family potassium uptake protein [Tindallia californiensis]SDZ09469.1 trk system potassium uptake protein TrkA [Tindallia californiensis]
MKQFAVIGCGRFGGSVAKSLYKSGFDVLALDDDECVIRNIADEVTHAATIDIDDAIALKEVGIRNMDVVIIGIGSDLKASVMSTLLVKEMGVPYVVAKAQDEMHAKVLTKIGADRVIFPERDMGIRLAYNLTSTNILDFIELSPDYSILEIVSPKIWHDKSLMENNIRSRFGLSILAIKREEEINVSPQAEEIIRSKDVLIVVGSNEDLRKVQEHE